MRVVGLIVEYNPFHHGHAYHLQEAKKLANADYVIAVMSGHFLQRGIPALMDQWTRTQMALNQGVDLVLQLPVYYSTSSAEYFASAAISLLNSLQIVDSVCFGSEVGDLMLLEPLAQILVEEPEPYRKALQESLTEGLSFPQARAKGLESYLNSRSSTTAAKYTPVLNSPNNILGIEYLKALLRTKSSMKALTLTRIGAGYHEVARNHTLASASAIRYALENNTPLSALKRNLPDKTYQLMERSHHKKGPLFLNDFTPLLYQILLSKSAEDLLAYVDVSEGLEDRIYKQRTSFMPISELISTLKTKRFTYTRIQRALMHILLDIKKSDFEAFNKHHYAQYIKILGFREASQPLLKAIKQHATLPLLSNVNKSFKILPSLAKYQLEKDLFATRLYNLIVYQKYGCPLSDDLTQKFIRVK